MFNSDVLEIADIVLFHEDQSSYLGLELDSGVMEYCCTSEVIAAGYTCNPGQLLVNFTVSAFFRALRWSDEQDPELSHWDTATVGFEATVSNVRVLRCAMLKMNRSFP
jgi:hypothetical protein